MSKRCFELLSLMSVLLLASGTAMPGDDDTPPSAVAPFSAQQARRHQDAWSEHLGKPVELTNSIGMKLAIIPPGEFRMGSGKSPEALAAEFETKAEFFEADHPQHRVRVTKPYYLGLHEVTQGEWERVMDTRPWSGKSYVKEGSEYAATYVSWEDALEFCKKLSAKEGREYRLPTEAEWEYACRAGTETAYHFGDDVSRLGDYAWWDGNADDADEDYAHVVGQKKANGFGLYDMHGNVYEWCADWYDSEYYANSPVDDPQGPGSSSVRVHRGGCWSYFAWSCRSALRSGSEPALRYYDLGFRVALVPADESGK